MTLAIFPNVFSQTELTQNQQYVSAESMQAYAQKVIAAYNETASRYFNSSKGNFSFYSESYSVKSFISYNGAAIWFEPSSIPSFENYNLSERVESLFGGDFSTWPLFFEPGHHVMIVGGEYVLNGHPLLTLSSISSVIFKDIYVNQTNSLQAYKCVIIKGSIETKHWSLHNATEEAVDILYSDTKSSFLVSEEVRQRYAEAELLTRLRDIQYRLANDTSYSPSDWLAELQNIEYIATTKYHLSDPIGFVNGLIAFLNARITGILPPFTAEPTPTPTPTPTPPPKLILHFPVDDPINLWYISFLSILPVLLFAVLVILDNYRRSNKPRALKILLTAIPAALGYFIYDLLDNPPHDLPWVSLGRLPVFLVWFIGVIVVYKGRKKLIRWSFPKSMHA